MAGNSVQKRLAIGIALFAAAYVGLHYLPTSDEVRRIALGIAYLLPPAAAAIYSLRVHGRVPAEEGRFWLFLGLGSTFLLAGEVYWVVWQLAVDPAGPPYPSPADAMYVLGYLALVVVPLSMARLVDALIVRRLRYILDLVIVTIVATMLTVLFVLRPVALAYPDAALMERVLNTFYPVADIVLLFGVVANALGFKRSRWRSWEVLVALGFGSFLVSDGVYNVFSAAGLYETGRFWSDMLDLGWIAGYGLFFAAAVLRERFEATSAAEEKAAMPSAGTARWPDFVVPLVALASIPVFLSSAHTGGPGSTEFEINVVAAMAVASLVVMRSFTLSLENTRLLSRSITDPLTGLFNHRHFHERLAGEMERSGRSAEVLSLALFDIDDFNQVNNLYGHVVGDRRLRVIAQRLLDCARGSDTVCRVGGDEFAVIMPDTLPVEAYKACLRIRQAMAKDDGVCELPTKASFGIAAFPLHTTDREELVRMADGALYWAKFHGRDQVVIYDADVVNTLSPEERIARVEEQSYLRTVEVLAAAVDARDSYTQFHSRNVAQLASMLASKLGFDHRRVRLIEIAALLHDVGKIGVPDNILRKPGTLTSEERSAVRDHPVLGERILGATTFRDILPWVLSHHERWDGGGYPQGIAGDEIPLEARILAVCDAYDAMTSDRPYRAGLSRDAALLELRDGAGSQFDPQLVSTFIELLMQQPAGMNARHPLFTGVGRERPPSVATDHIAIDNGETQLTAGRVS